MQFTPQQLSGGPKYSSVTRIGNWQEEIVLEESKRENFVKRSNTGNLSLRQMETKLTKCQEIVPHSYAEDGIIRFGDTIILQHDKSGCILACDPFEDQMQGQEKYLVTGTLENPAPKSRNTFRILRPPSKLKNFEDDENDPVVHYGQPFCLGCNESLLVTAGSNILAPTLYLSSSKKTERTSTKSTNRQMVCMSPLNDPDSIWFVVKPSRGHTNSAERFLAVGQSISVNDSIQFTHRQTNMYLTCDNDQKMRTEFGIELECYCGRSTAPGKLGLLVSEFQGLSTAQTLAKPDAPVFSWHCVLSSDPRTAVDTRSLPVAATVDAILCDIRDWVKSRGVDGYWQLHAYFQNLEKGVPSEGKLDREDLKECLVSFGLPVRLKYLDKVLDLIDKRQLGLIDWRELLRVFRGPLPAHRQNVVSTAFNRLDIAGTGSVLLESLASKFSGLDHPLVSLGGMSDRDALSHVLDHLQVQGGRTVKTISLAAFTEYYADLSACVDDDAYFEAVVRSNWANAFQK